MELCEQKKISRGYVITKEMDDFGPMQANNGTLAQIMRIPAPLLCYWMGATEIAAKTGP